MVRVIERCVGLDVHRNTLAACIRISGTKDRPEQHIQTFGTTAADLFPAASARCAQDLWPLQARVAAVAAVDGSRLVAQRANRGGGCARPRCRSVGFPASRWTQFSSNRGQVGGGSAAPVRRGSTGNRCRMCVVIIKILKLS